MIEMIVADPVIMFISGVFVTAMLFIFVFGGHS